MPRYTLQVLDSSTGTILRFESTDDEDVMKSWVYNGADNLFDDSTLLQGNRKRLGQGRPSIGFRFRYEYDPTEKPQEAIAARGLAEALRLPLTAVQARLRKLPKWMGESVTFPHCVIGEYRVWRAACEDGWRRKQLRETVNTD